MVKYFPPKDRDNRFCGINIYYDFTFLTLDKVDSYFFQNDNTIVYISLIHFCNLRFK